MRRFVGLLLLVFGCGGCTWLDTPQPTEAGWRLFSYVDDALDANRKAVVRAVQFDEYYRQTTDEGRREVQDRYFPLERIVNDGNVWRILSTESAWIFELSDGLALSEAGAEWRISGEKEGSESEFKVQITASDNGSLSVKSEIGLSRFATLMQATLRIRRNALEIIGLEFLAGDGILNGLDSPRLDVNYTITEPIVYADQYLDPQLGGVLDITAHNEAEGPLGADEQVTARYMENGDVEITYRGETRIWTDEMFFWE